MGIGQGAARAGLLAERPIGFRKRCHQFSRPRERRWERVRNESPVAGRRLDQTTAWTAAKCIRIHLLALPHIPILCLQQCE
jgi:hypothetical protein